MYRDHLAMIDLNPLVIERYKCKPPNYAPTSEYYATWYTIKDIRGKWSVGGSLPGEPKQHTQTGHKVPRNGLYIREEVSMTCSKLLLGFVKKTFKDSHSRLVEKLVERAHILESNFANERLKALRNVEPRERMGHGDIFIAPPPDYQFAPPPYQAQASPRFFPHSRSQSANPILTPGLSQSLSFTERSASVSSAPAQQNRPSSSQSALHANGPEQSVYLLPATTYDGGLSASFNRPISLYPGSASHAPSIRVVSLYYETMVDETESDDETDEENEPISTHIVSPPRIPEARPMSFNFSFNQLSPGPMTPISNEDLLADIDAAIDESYIYSSPNTRYDALPTPNSLQTASQIDTLPAMTYELLPTTTYKASPTTISDTLPANTYSAAPEQTLDTLPSTAYTPGPFLPSTKYELKHERKDSVIPFHAYSESPPVPPKDEKYRRPSQVAV
ncbi:hypothetical protein N0V95_005080 [Ascochyta clinopodiicola]|nr:hypothetical protein N0V95_005080 [Ascochyta clinopodiicola]